MMYTLYLESIFVFNLLSKRRVILSNIYLLKDIARISGQSIYTVKYYLKIGLIKETGRSPDTNFRFFNDSTVERLHKIRELRVKRTKIKEINEILSAEERK